jgi:hypothetical protein
MATEIIQIDTQQFLLQDYEVQDTNLLTSFDIDTSLSSSSYIELFVYDNNKNILSSDLNFTEYTVQNNGQSSGDENSISEIILDPESILVNLGYDQGEYITYFNFLNKNLGSELQTLYISEISSDRTEIRLDSLNLTNLDIIEQTNNFIQERENSSYFLDFYLNFGNNNLILANNILLDGDDPNNPTILIKLYEPLLEEFDINSSLWVVSPVEESVAYQVKFDNPPIVFTDTTPLKGPNFNIELKDQINNSTLSLSYNDLISTNLSSSLNQLNSLLEEKEIDINVDYTDFSDFIHFSSAVTRISNFYYKVQLIEQYSSSISVLNTTNSASLSVLESKTIYENKIDEIITNFDGYEYYLYYSSGSWSYPKTTSEPPYQLSPTNSQTVLNWLGSLNESSPLYGGIIVSASLYDNQNKDNLLFSIPEYLRDNPDNDGYELFIDMIAQHFDNIWLYYKDVTQKYNADNRLEFGISKDIVADAIRDFGVKLYQNNFSNTDLYTAFLGLTPDGALFPFPNITGSLPTPSGFEYVDTLISASNDYLPLDDVNKSLYKRIYHNLPYLLKAKGTLPGLRALITSYGIPDTILRINEYGGKDKVDSNDWDYWQNEFNYAFYTTGSNFIETTWGPLNSSWSSSDGVPNSLSFRFKTNGLPQDNIPYSQSLWNLSTNEVFLTLKYTGTGFTSGSYSGSIPDPYNQYAYLEFYPNYSLNPTISSSIFLPFFNGDWWSITINRFPSSSGASDYILYAGNKIYEGGDNGTIIGFYSTSSAISADDAPWVTYQNSYFAKGGFTINGETYNNFSGSLQEIRYYTNPIDEDVFKDYIMNPYSIEGNSLNSGPNELAFRASLGGELYTGSVSIHPKVTGSWTTTSSFISNSNFNFNSTPVFLPNIEYFFYDQPIAGIKNTVSDKIRLENNSLPSGSILSPIRALSQTIAASASYTPNINYLEVAFSPQNEINEDIMDQLGYFNIGEYIGDPSFRSSPLQTYPNLDNLRNRYFEKYIKNYDLVDFIRLIKFFDNSLFKMIKDFVPARTSLASGIVIKQHILERNRYPQPQVNWEDLDISGTLKPTWNDYNPGTVENFSGGTGGSFEIFNGINTSPYGADGNGPDNIFGITQSWNETYRTPLGPANITHDFQEEFYDGEFSGSVILITTQSLNQPYSLENASFEYTPILYTNNLYNQLPFSSFTEGQFLHQLTTPYSGEMLIMAPRIRRTINIGGLVFPKGNAYIKISKIDCNNNNNALPLGQISNLLIKYSSSLNYTNYTVLNINEYPTYYLYQISNQNIDTTGSGIDNEIKDYYVSSSITSSRDLTKGAGSTTTIGSWNTILGNLPHYGTPYFNTSSGYYTLENTPNIPIAFTASFHISGSAMTSHLVRLKLLREGVTSTIFQTGYNTVLNNPIISGTLYPLKTDQYFVEFTLPTSPGDNIWLISASLLITQSIIPTASVCDPIILEPYITTPNFYNSDQNAILNNAEDTRLSSFYQDVDYSTGILTPTNFNLLINNLANKAPVQDSNYTTKRHIIPRYNGSKSTSQKLNVWTSGDEGTYGKTPTIESLKNYIAYCDFIGGWPPEKMNASGAHILYLIGKDGDVIIPNTSENSLSINKGTFESGERVLIESRNFSTGEALPYRNIIRGGTRVEPILYNQLGHSPASFTSSIELTDSNQLGGVVSDFQGLVKYSGNLQTSLTEIPWSTLFASGSSSGMTSTGSPLRYRFIVSSAMINEGVSIILKSKIDVKNNNSFISSAWAQIKNLTTNAVVSEVRGVESSGAPYGLLNPGGTGTINLQHLITSDQLVAGHEYIIEAISGHSNIAILNTSEFRAEQSPIPNSIIPTTNLFSIYSSPDIIFTTQSSLVNFFGNSNTFQKDIPGSGFNQIANPWFLKYGDEIRFEGDENKVWMIKDAYVTQSLGISSLFIQIDRAITGSININEFLFRRYVNDPTAILLEGYKPIGSQGPFLVKPEYCSPELNKDIDQFILDLTQKGLL